MVYRGNGHFYSTIRPNLELGNFVSFPSIYLLFSFFNNFCDRVGANLTRVISPPNSNTGGTRLIISVPFSYISFSSFTFPAAPYWIFLLLLPWFHCHFYLVIEQQLYLVTRFLPKICDLVSFSYIFLLFLFFFNHISCYRYLATPFICNASLRRNIPLSQYLPTSPTFSRTAIFGSLLRDKLPFDIIQVRLRYPLIPVVTIFP